MIFDVFIPALISTTMSIGTPNCDPPNAPVHPGGGVEEPGPVEVVDNVDLDRYLGQWFEIASYPSPFSRNCAGTNATYTQNPDGTVGVLNRCTIGSLEGEEIAIEGFAKVVDPETNAKLEVFLGGGPGGEYWIVALDETKGEQYDWAVVSNSDRSSLFILSRTPQIDDTLLGRILDDLEERGWALDTLQFTEQPVD